MEVSVYEEPRCGVHKLISIIFLIVSLLITIRVYAESSVDDAAKPCTFFSSARNSSPEHNLVNCSWFSENACCRRTEVTSVFDGMYPLMSASIECTNRINYLMCYFCSPMQYLWYDSHAKICSNFCKSMFEHCLTAKYNGIPIEDQYSNGSAFCEGQHFSVTDGGHCFDFDENVFGSSPKRCSNFNLLMTAISLEIIVITDFLLFLRIGS